MTYSSPSVEFITEKSKNAQKAINYLKNELISKDKENNDYFDNLTFEKLETANINDGRIINSGKNIKTKYTSEFSLDKITNIIINTLKIIEKNCFIENSCRSARFIFGFN